MGHFTDGVFIFTLENSVEQSNQEKGKSFETLVANMFNLFLDLTGRNRVKPMPRSGAFKE